MARSVSAALDRLDAFYPPGSRVVLLGPEMDPHSVQLLSEGLVAAGDPVVAYDGERVFFVGKAKATGDWQIYESRLPDGHPTQLTSIPGGAMSPALLPDGSVVFASPVPAMGSERQGGKAPALYVQSGGGHPRRLTFSNRGVEAPTLLADGRILFVSSSSDAAGARLLTINNDGTEVAAFAARQADGIRILRPRQLPDGRMIYLVAGPGEIPSGGVAESVRMARPFLSRTPVFPEASAVIRSVEPASNGELLISALTRPESATSPAGWALFRAPAASTALGKPLLADAEWNVCEAVECAPHPRPMGRLSSVDPAQRTGRILCLDANRSSESSKASGIAVPLATQVRILAEASPGVVRALGEVAVQPDGSFMAEVPAETPLGFEALDREGHVLRREIGMLWVRPGENRSCVGCHEPHNHSPHNHRPLAVGVAVPRLTLVDADQGGAKGGR